MIRFPVLCGNCHSLAQCCSVEYGWATVCPFCYFGEFQSDVIRLGQEER